MKLVIVLLILVTMTATAQPFTVSNKLENRWRWLHGIGTPTEYVIEKYVSGQWKENSRVPATVENGYVYATVISPSAEIYKIQVTAIDNKGNKSEPSPESDWLLVFPESASRPEIK